MGGTAQEIAMAVKSIVAEAGPLPGSRLAGMVKERFPEWNPADFEVRNLREFISAHVSEVVVAGRSGMDVIYASGAMTVIPTDPSLAVQDDVDFWRVWVSPNSPYRLSVDRTTAALHALRRGVSAGSDELVLDPPGIDIHRSVAQEFLPGLPIDLQARLKAVLDAGSSQWWQSWVSELRASDRLLSWNTFRHEKFEKQMSDRLRAEGMEQATIDRVLETVQRRPAAARPGARRISALKERDDRGELRRIVAESIQRMSVAELRELRLPIGIVLDVLATLNAR